MENKKPYTALMCTCYIGNEDHYKRYLRWFEYYLTKKQELGYDKIFIFDDGSQAEYLIALAKEVSKHGVTVDPVRLGGDSPSQAINIPDPKDLKADVTILSFPKNLGRPCLQLFPGWWRSYSFAGIVAEVYGYDKLIHIESDAYIVSEKCFDFIRTKNDGFNVLWSEHSQYPETSIQWLTSDFFHILAWYWRAGELFWYKNHDLHDVQYIPELRVPFTNIIKQFTGDRYGDDYFEEIPFDCDYICNVHDSSLNNILQTNYSTKFEQFKTLMKQKQDFTFSN